MKRVVYIFLGCLMLSGCKTTSFKDKSHIITDQLYVKEEVKDVAKDSIFKIIEVTEVDNTTVIKETVYDTTKPLNEATGKHPIKSEKETTSTTKANKEKDSSGSVSNTDKSTIKENTDTHIDDNKDIKSKTDTSSWINDLKWSLVLLLSLVIVVVIITTYKKLRRV